MPLEKTSEHWYPSQVIVHISSTGGTEGVPNKISHAPRRQRSVRLDSLDLEETRVLAYKSGF